TFTHTSFTTTYCDNTPHRGIKLPHNTTICWYLSIPANIKLSNSFYFTNYSIVTAFYKNVFEWTCWCCENNGEFGCITFNGKITYHIQCNNVLMQLWLNNCAECLHNSVFNLGHVSPE